MFKINGQPIPKKNSMQIRYKNSAGRRVPFIAQNDRYKEYEESAVWQLRTQRQPIPNPPYNVKCVFYRKNRLRCDLVNLIESVDDILTRAGIIPDDNFEIVAGHDGSRVLIDKENPRTEIEITSIKERST